MLAVANDAQFARVCELLDEPGLAADPRFKTNAGRVTNREILVDLLSARMAPEKRDCLLAGLERVGVPAGPINTLDDVFHDPQIVDRAMRIDLPAPWTNTGRVPGVRVPIRFSRSGTMQAKASPRFGELQLDDLKNSQQVWADLVARTVPSNMEGGDR
jgi:crotonobetainyl-CoA:carnitine CoA-transferase CaiB-like acyl-CoA transferase